MIKIHDVPEEAMQAGYYFKPGNMSGRCYLVVVDKLEKGFNVILSVYPTDLPRDSNPSNGDEVLAYVHKWTVLSLDVWGKYFFPKFNVDSDDYQWYHG